MEPQKNEDLHGNVPDACPAALLLIDVINDLDFPRNEDLLRMARMLGENIARLKRRCKDAGIPVVYVNDNRGRWRSDFSVVLKHCLRAEAPGRPLVENLVPDADDYIILKPKHSAFYATPLDTLLTYARTKRVILSGLTTNACVLMAASEVYVRDLELFIPSDCVAALSSEEHRSSLDLMMKSFGADTRLAKDLDVSRILRTDD